MTKKSVLKCYVKYDMTMKLNNQIQKLASVRLLATFQFTNITVTKGPFFYWV